MAKGSSITTGQIRLIHVAKRELSLDDDTYRDILHAQAGVRSCKDLDRDGVDKVLNRFKELGFKLRKYPSRKERQQRKKKNHYPDNVYELMTFEQKLKLDHLKHDLHLTWLGYQNLCSRTIGRKRPVTIQNAQKMIECMKAMVKRRGE